MGVLWNGLHGLITYESATGSSEPDAFFLIRFSDENSLRFLVILYIIYHKIREGHLIWLGEA